MKISLTQQIIDAPFDDWEEKAGQLARLSQRFEDENAALRAEKDRLSTMADKLLAHMDDGTHEPGGECSVCATICCPHGEPLHFHHDGCPACHTPTPT